MNRLNLIILGASGGVAKAFLHKLVHHRELFNKIFLLDKKDSIIHDEFLNHKKLNYKFIHKEIILPREEEEYRKILKKNKIDIVLDLTDMDSLPVIEATDKAGRAYVNTALNDNRKAVTTLVYYLISKLEKIKNSPQILCAGMNPGVVNLWVRYGIEKFSKPQEIIHFEYDTSRTVPKWQPVITWSLKEYLMETVQDKSAVMLGRNKVKEFSKAIENIEPMKPILSPIMNLDEDPYGFVILHEENITLAQKYDIPSKFIYSVNKKTMDYILSLYEKNKKIKVEDLALGDNTEKILDGSDNVGVVLDYPDKKVYYLNSFPNLAIMDTNATYTQVITGIFAALITLIKENLKPGVYFTEDLYNTIFKQIIFDNMRIQEFVFDKKGKSLTLASYNPRIKTEKIGERFFIC